jgi:glycolate oxidase FAD binding subunit
MAVGVVREAPHTAAEAAERLRAAAERGERVRIVGTGTKRWGARGEGPDLELRTTGLDRVVEHNEGDFTAVVEAGVTVGRLRAQLAEAGQMLALDPPGDEATLGGLVAAGDSGPLRHRYGAPRDLVIGVRVALVDGTVARAGGRVIKNVAGYDLGKLFAASFGTLGVICELSLRLHPRPAATATAVGRGGHPDALAAAARDVAHRPFEADALDVRWDGDGDGGSVLVRFSGEAAAERAGRVLGVLRAAGLESAVDGDDEATWAAQRAGQRSPAGSVVRVSATQDRLVAVLEAGRAVGATLVGRAAHGLSWLRIEDVEPAEAVERVRALRARLAPSPCVVLDAPDEVRDAVDPWGPVEPGALALMRSVKAHFDPSSTLNPGTFVGGI